MGQLRVVFFALSLLCASPSRGIEVTRDVQRNEYTVYRSGPIVAGELKKIVAAVGRPEAFPRYFTLRCCVVPPR